MPRTPWTALAAVFFAGAVPAQNDDPAMHTQHMAAATTPTPTRDMRRAVKFPAPLKLHTLANMRDHLLALQEIQQALAQADYGRAADIAEWRIGMSSLGLHGAHEVSKYMPREMRDTGSAMHRAASRFSIAASDAGATGDVKPALAALGDVMAACVACHAGYHFK